jgi:uncharacterized protein YnzC (UPF0291/DUF896 family)
MIKHIGSVEYLQKLTKEFGGNIEKAKDVQKYRMDYLKKIKYSLKYLIHECRYIAQNTEHFETVYGKTYQRIRNIEEYILENKYLSYESLRKIELEVFEDENLHPYWEHKLNMLISIGLL